MTRAETVSTMSAFYDRAGVFLKSHTLSAGAFPTRTHIAVFEYENGEAVFDGAKWKWSVGPVEGGTV
jgi:hypothetical protein